VTGRIAKNRVALAQMKRKLNTLQKYLPVFEKQRAALNKMLQEEENVHRQLAEDKAQLTSRLKPWIALFNDSEADIGLFIALRAVRSSEENVFGSSIPLYCGVDFEEFPIDFRFYPLWVPEGIAAVKQMAEADARLEVSARRLEAIRRGYEEANQKVNLFDKKLIPETRSAIRDIKAALDARSVSSIVIAKSAKKLQAQRNTA
jgi:V/A-type H+-transporting ATPase subunit D